MDSRSSTAEPNHHYHHPASFAHLSTASPVSRQDAIANSATEASSPLFTHLKILPILFPQQSVYEAQLLHYNELVAPGRGRGGALQNPPHPPPPQPPSTHSHSGGPRTRSSSKVSNKDVPASKSSGNQSCHGNRGSKNTDKTDRAVIAGKESVPAAPTAAAAAAVAPKMPPKQADLAHPLPSRPGRPHHSHQHQHQHQQASARAPAQASSVPSTPHQHARNFSFESREPSPNATQNHSPRSTYSDPNGNLTSLRPLPPRLGGCGYETALVRSRRRMPYSLGVDRLEPVEESKIKSKLSEDEERKLTTDMRELYDRLKPTDKVKGNREKLVKKLEKIFNDEWQGRNIKVHLFGSSGNKLCSDDSDLDICITTDWKELENVCIIAELLAKRGMDKVVCVSSAKVPIVKIWDPELSLACDMNVNNTLALENTRMVLTYVEIDERVRPLAMIIKHWTRRRVINDAAFGGTLSSYTWICMIIAFLQLRDPPVLPALHQSPHRKPPPPGGKKSEFADDLSKLRGYGNKNKETLGELLFHFFRFYAHVFDYDKWALSIRQGKKVSKNESKWHLNPNNMLCVEEPFNTIRNLGNTADDTSFRGLHLELRRAFDLVAEAKLDECCQQFEFPKEEERIWQKPAPAPRPVLVRSSSQQHSTRGGRGAYRGRNNHRGNNRRASSSVAYENNPALAQPGFQSTTTPTSATLGHESWFANAAAAAAAQQVYPQVQAHTQAQAQAQYSFVSPEGVFPAQLYSYPYDHNNLRYHFLSQLSQSQQYAQQQAFANMQRLNGVAGGGSGGGGTTGSSGSQATDRSRAGSFDQPPLSAPLRGPEFAYYPHIPMATQYLAQTGFTTYPSSPSTTTGTPEFRRSLHRSTVTGEAGPASGSAALRSQSQPASRSPMPTSTTQSGGLAYQASTQAATAAAAAAAAAGGIPATAHSMGDLSAGGNMSPYQTRQANGAPISFIPNDDMVDPETFDDGTAKSLPDSPPEENTPRYVGYYVSDSSSPPKKTLPNGIAFGDLGQNQGLQPRRRLSTDQSPQSILDRRMRRTSRSPSPLGSGSVSGANHTRAYSVGGACSAPLGSTATFPSNGIGSSKLSMEARPVVVNGSGSKPPSSVSSSSRQPSASEGTASEASAAGSDHNPLHITHGLGLNGHRSPEKTPVLAEAAPSTGSSATERPRVVNGSATPLTPASAGATLAGTPSAKSFNQRAAAAAAAMNSPHTSSPLYPRIAVGDSMGMGMGADGLAGFAAGMAMPMVAGMGFNMAGQVPMSAYPQLSPAVRSRLVRQQQQNGVIAPLDLAIADHTLLSPDFQHLSPVYETRTPSPTVIRKFDGHAPSSSMPMSAAAAASQAMIAGYGVAGRENTHPGAVPSRDFIPEQASSGASKGRQPRASQPQPDAGAGAKQEQHAAPARVNGHAAKEAGAGGRMPPPRIDTGVAGSGWQKPKGRKKPADLKNLSNGFSQSEQLPKNEAERKGG